jgi:hypothetical protein
MECVHLKEQPEDLQHLTSLHALYTARSQNKLFLNDMARVPEVTSMQVFECNGEEWKITTPDIIA